MRLITNGKPLITSRLHAASVDRFIDLMIQQPAYANQIESLHMTSRHAVSWPTAP